MPATANWYGQTSLGLVSAVAARRWDWVTDTIKLTLYPSAGYTPNQDTHVFASSLAGELANGNGYTTGGVTLATKTTVYDSATNTTRIDAADASWTFSAAKSMRYGVVWKDTGVAATSPLIAYIDFNGSGDETSSGVFTIQFDATDGVIRMVSS